MTEMVDFKRFFFGRGEEGWKEGTEGENYYIRKLLRFSDCSGEIRYGGISAVGR